MIHLGLQSGLKTTIASVTRHSPEREVLLRLSVGIDTRTPFIHNTLARDPLTIRRAEETHTQLKVQEPYIPEHNRQPSTQPGNISNEEKRTQATKMTTI